MSNINRRIGRLTAITIGFAVVGLVLVGLGMRGARDFILSQIATNSAVQWAEILSYSIEDPALGGDIDFESMRISDRVDRAVSDGLILWYGVFSPEGEVIASSTDIDMKPFTPEELDALQNDEIASRSNIAHEDGFESPTTAEAFYSFQSTDQLLGYVGVRISRAEAGPLLDRILLFAFVGLCVLVFLIGGTGILLLRRYLINQGDLEQQLSRTTKDLERSEAVAQVGHWSQEVLDGYSQWSQGMYAICGRDPSNFDLTNESVLSCIHPEDRQHFQDNVDHMVKTSGGFEMENRILRPDGSVRYVYMKGGTELDEDGNVIRRFGVTQDITERKEADLALSRNEDMVDRAIEATGAAIWDWDLIEDDLFTTPRFAEILGIDDKDWQPSMAEHYQLCHPDDVDRVRQHFQDHMYGKAPYDIEYRMR